MRGLPLTFTLVAALGCGSSSASSAAVCETAIVQLEGAIDVDLESTLTVPDVSGISPPRREAIGVPVSMRPFIYVTADGVGIHSVPAAGQAVETAELLRLVDVMGRNMRTIRPGQTHDKVVHIVAERSLSMAHVDAVIAPLAAEGYSFVVLALLPERAAPPCPPGWEEQCRQLAAVSGADRAMLLAGMNQQLLRQGGCAPLDDVFADLAPLSGEEKGPELQRRLPGALRSCGCAGLNMERLTYLMVEPLEVRRRVTGVTYVPGGSGTVGEWVRAH